MANFLTISISVIGYFILLSICLLFVYYWLVGDDFDEYKKIKKQPISVNRLDAPLNQFCFNSSHNSYIRYAQDVGTSSNYSIQNVLELGARCIELDIHNYYGIPVVAHGTDKFLVTTYISLESALDTIVKYGFNTSDPLILFCEIFSQSDSDYMLTINKLFKDKLSNKIYKLSDPISKTITDKPINIFQNKLILFGTNAPELSELFNDPSNYANWDSDDTRLLKPNDLLSDSRIKRVYNSPSPAGILSFNYDPIPILKINII